MVPIFGKKKENARKQTDKSIPWPDHVESLTHETFHEFIGKYPLSMIDFWAPWCGPCKTMLPRLRRIERLYHGKIAIGRVNTQDEKDIADQYKIMGIPHFVFFHYTKKIGSTNGVKSVGDLKSLIDTYLSKY
jgi:thioredoxin 1